MTDPTLHELRARLRAEAVSPPRVCGSLRALKAILAPPLPPPAQPTLERPIPVSSPIADFASRIEEPISLPERRSTFGQRLEPLAEQPPMQLGPGASLDIVEPDEPVGPRTAMLRRLQETSETPFLPEDVHDQEAMRAEQLYAEAGLPSHAAPGDESRTEPLSPLIALEQRLLEEHSDLIRTLTRANAVA